TITTLHSISFFHIHPPPPTSTLFPYTTLFRSVHQRVRARENPHAHHSRQAREGRARASRRHRSRGLRVSLRHERERPAVRPGTRSEEHTSELQSQSNLVCRLLLEKKKTKI